MTSSWCGNMNLQAEAFEQGCALTWTVPSLLYNNDPHIYISSLGPRLAYPTAYKAFHLASTRYLSGASQVVLVAKNLPANAGDTRDTSSIPGSGRSPGEGHGNPLWYSCLENPMDRGASWDTVHGVAKSQTRLKPLSMHARGS